MSNNPKPQNETTEDSVISKAKKALENSKLNIQSEDSSLEMLKTDPKDETNYIIFARSLSLVNGNGESVQLKQGDIITKADYPVAWVEMAVTQKLLIDEKVKNSLTNEQLASMGYTGIKAKSN